MNIDKSKILDNICYTEVVYERINKNLKTNNSKLKIENKYLKIFKQTSKENFEKMERIITVDRIVKK